MIKNDRTQKHKVIPIFIHAELVDNPNSPIRRIRNPDGTVRHERIPELKITEIEDTRLDMSQFQNINKTFVEETL